MATTSTTGDAAASSSVTTASILSHLHMILVDKDSARVENGVLVCHQDGFSVSLDEKVPLASGKGRDVVYTVGQLWLAARYPVVAEYLRASREHDIKLVSLVDRQEVINLLKRQGQPAATADPESKRVKVGDGLTFKVTDASSAPSASSSSVPTIQPVPLRPSTQTAGGQVPAGFLQQSSTTASSRPAAAPTASATTGLGSLLQGIPTNAQKAIAREIVYYDRNAVLLASRSFQEVMEIDAKSKDFEDSKEQGRKASSRETRKLGSSVPIIVVPASQSATLNLWNIKQFLEDRRYVTPEEARKEMESHVEDPNSVVKPTAVMVAREHPAAGVVRYKCVDSVLDFDDAHWNRVVAVVVSGQAWQFKDWRNSEPSEIFAKIQGCYLFFDDVKLTDTVRAWNVATFPVKRQSRYRDAVQAHAMWMAIDAKMATHHSALMGVLMDEADRRKKSAIAAQIKGMQLQMEDNEDDDEEPAAESQAKREAGGLATGVRA